MAATARLPLRRRIALAALSALVVVAALAYVNAPLVGAWWYAWRHGLAADTLDPALGFDAGDRVLVVSPHPDDEALCCAGMIQAAVAVGADVWIVHLTSGDGFELDAIAVERTLRPRGAPLVSLGRIRMEEARTAAEVLGVPEERVWFVGFPDRGLLPVYRHYWSEPYRSPYTGRSFVPYPTARTPGLPFTGGNLLAEMERVFGEVDPTVLLAPTPLDVHPDHRAAGEIVLRLLLEREQLDSGRWWIVHGDPQWPLPKGRHLDASLFPPLRARALPWQRFDLEREQVQVKLEAIHAHATQVLWLRRYLEAFARSNELVSPLPLPGAWLPEEPGR